MSVYRSLTADGQFSVEGPDEIVIAQVMVAHRLLPFRRREATDCPHDRLRDRAQRHPQRLRDVPITQTFSAQIDASLVAFGHQPQDTDEVPLSLPLRKALLWIQPVIQN